MPPDFLLECTVCGSEAVWDTEAIPPVGLPAVGHPVLWFCQTCATEQRHAIADLCVMAEAYHHRQRASQEAPTARLDPAQEVEEVAEAAGVPLDVVEQISVAEAAWMLRRGHILESPVDA